MSLSVNYDCGCKVSVIRPADGGCGGAQQFLLMCVKHTIELNQITDDSLEELR